MKKFNPKQGCKTYVSRTLSFTQGYSHSTTSWLIFQNGILLYIPFCAKHKLKEYNIIASKFFRFKGG